MNDAAARDGEDTVAAEPSKVCGREVFMPSDEGVADERPGLSNCRNCSISACCAVSGSGAGVGGANNFDQPLFSFCWDSVCWSGVELSHAPDGPSGFRNPPLMEFDMPCQASGSSQARSELPIWSALVWASNTSWLCLSL